MQGPASRLINIYAGLTERGSLACRVCLGDRNQRCVVDDQKQEDKIGDRESTVGTAATGRMLARRGSTDAGSIPRPYRVPPLFPLPTPFSPFPFFFRPFFFFPESVFNVDLQGRARAHVYIYTPLTHALSAPPPTPTHPSTNKRPTSQTGTTWPMTPCDVAI